MRNDGPRSISRQGGWLNFVIAGISALASYSSSKSAGKRASSLDARSLALQERQAEIAEAQEGRAEELYGDYRRVYQPNEEKLVSEAFDTPLSAQRAESRATADVRGSLATARGSSERRMRGLGINPASGRYAGIERATSLTEAAIETGARTSAREGVRDKNFARKLDVLQMGRGLPGTVGSMSAQAGSTMGYVASLADSRARDARDYAYESGRNTGRLFGEALDEGVNLWQNRDRRSTPATLPPSRYHS